MPVTGMNKALQQGLVLWLKMSEGVGTRLHDVSGYQNNGTINGASWVDGKYGKALSFNGTSDYVNLGATKFDTLGDGTIAFWVKCGEIISDTYVFGHRKDSSNYFSIQVFIDNPPYSLKFSAQIRVGAVSKYARSDAIYTTGWTHIAVMFGSGGLKMYINGVLQSTSDPTTNGFDDIGVSTTNLIGALLSSFGWLLGIIDEFRIYNRALNAYEMAKLYRERGYV